MEIIKELVNVIDSYKVQHVEVLQNPFTTENKYSSFYKGIQKGTILNDADASRILYDSSPENHKYKKIKYRFRQRLLNSILFIDVNKPNYTDIQKAYYNCYKGWATVRVLLGKGAKNSAITLAEKILRHALKYEFTELSCSASKVLRLYFATTAGSKKKYLKYNELYKEQTRILKAEAFAEELYSDLLVDFVASRATKRKYLKKAAQYSEELQPYMDKIQSYNFLFFAYSIIVGRYEIDNDPENVILHSQKAYELLSQKEFELKVQIFPFLFKMLTCYVKLGNYLLANSLIIPCLDSLDEGSVNWFKFNQIHFIHLMHMEEYKAAGELVLNTRKDPRIKYQSFDTREIWKIYEAYTYFIDVYHKDDSDQSVRNRFKLGKFLNEVPVFSKDKDGLNISILIVQILILLKNKKYNRIIDLISSLERYSTRYLRKNETYRSNCFIKMLITLPKGNFSFLAVQRHSEKFYKKLLEVPLNQSEQSVNIEIIPYERLWKFILDEL